MMDIFSNFHFLRPWWLLALLPAAWLTWRIHRSENSQRAWRGIIAAHLLPHLLIGKETPSGRKPLFWLVAGWLLTTVALAGPTWRREPSPFADDTAALVIVVKVTPSMRTEDIQPNRLARGVEKIHDLLALRPAARTALIAYAGSPHRVLPLTRDSDIINSFASELDPSIMPLAGDSALGALAMADELLTRSKYSGWILWVADEVETAQLKGLAAAREQRKAPVDLLATVSANSDRRSLETAATALGARMIPVTPDDADVRQLLSRTRFSTVSEAEGGQRWRDEGYWLVPAITLISLFWFRPGWMVQSASR